MPTFYEFFADGGMARAGLGPEWRCLLANDLSAMKARALGRERRKPRMVVLENVYGALTTHDGLNFQNWRYQPQIDQ